MCQLISFLFKSKSAFEGYLVPTPSLGKPGMVLLKWFRIFSESLKMNELVQVEFEHAHYHVIVKHFSHCIADTSPENFRQV